MKEQTHGGPRRDCFSLLYFGNSHFLFYFMSLFRHSVWFSFSVKQFRSAEFSICNISLRIDDKNQTAEGMSEKKASAIDLFYGKVYPIILD